MDECLKMEKKRNKRRAEMNDIGCSSGQESWRRFDETIYHFQETQPRLWYPYKAILSAPFAHDTRVNSSGLFDDALVIQLLFSRIRFSLCGSQCLRLFGTLNETTLGS